MLRNAIVAEEIESGWWLENRIIKRAGGPPEDCAPQYYVRPVDFFALGGLC